MATRTAGSGIAMIALAQIRHDRNVRQELAASEVDALAQSIALLGQLTPVSVRPDGEGAYVLIAGHKRYAALAQLGHTEIRAEIRADGEAEESERAAENIVRSQLNPYEEAVAVKAMLDRGLTDAGVAQALGWSPQRVTARGKLLELPEAAQRMIGEGRIALSAVDQLRAIGAVSPPLLDALIAFLADGNEWAAERLAREPGWVVDSALRAGDGAVFAEHLSTVNTYELAGLRLGKKTDGLVERATELHKKLDRYAYGARTFRFAEADIDQARAAGVLIEFEHAAPIIVDRGLYRQLCKAAITRTVTDLEAQVAACEQERKAGRQRSGAADPVAEAQRDERRQLRDIAAQAHGVNLDVGAGLLTGLSTVDPSDTRVARFFVYALLGSDHDGSPYTATGERVARLAASGIRLVIEQFRTDATQTRKDGTPGQTRIQYTDPHDLSEPITWLWRFVDGARTAGELYGRALVVICAEQYASRLVVPQSQRAPASPWASHKDHARKALHKLAAPHLPASLGQLRKAVERAHDAASRTVEVSSGDNDSVPPGTGEDRAAQAT
jgi:ParB/RepB/Spo0J family partition protein